MSSENVELVKALLPQRLDFVQISEAGLSEEFWSGFEPDFEVEFVSSMPDLDRPRYRGAAGIAEGWRDWLTPWESYSGDVEEILDAGDDVRGPRRFVRKPGL